MQIVEVAGRADLAQIYLMQVRNEPGSIIECVGALDPALPRSEKMVIVVSTQLGCPVACTMCEAGRSFRGNLRVEEILGQVQHVLEDWAGPDAAHCKKLKVQFARMGEPSLNPAVLEALERLPQLVSTPGLMPCIATTAPKSAERWMVRLHEIRDRLYGGGNFQLQFSIQSTSEQQRNQMIPIPKWSLRDISRFAERFVRAEDRKLTLNFAWTRGIEVNPDVLADCFDPATAMVKFTPLNPTDRSTEEGWSSAFETECDAEVQSIVDRIRAKGFDCLISVGLPEESEMRSSCGQLVKAHLTAAPKRPVSQSLEMS